MFVLIYNFNIEYNKTIVNLESTIKHLICFVSRDVFVGCGCVYQCFIIIIIYGQLLCVFMQGYINTNSISNVLLWLYLINIYLKNKIILNIKKHCTFID